MEEAMTRMRVCCTSIAVVVLIFSFCLSFNATLLPHSFIDSVVAIGRTETNPGPMLGKWVIESSGFLYGEFSSKTDDTHAQYHIYLVTNRHVITEHASATQGPLVVRFNLKSTAKEYEAPLMMDGKPTWHAHPNPLVDLVVISIDANVLKRDGATFDYFRSDRDLLTRDKERDIGLSEGDGVFVLGYPMGIVDGEQDYVIVRQGVIARIKNMLDSPSVTTFLLDAFIFPGNSGGPVVSKPEMVSIRGSKAAIEQAYLLGIVQGFRPYIDVAVSSQTKRPRVTFEENSGLADVVPAEYIQETINDFKKIYPALESTSNH
jgi:S1-C subfamily serine protease